MLAIHSQKQAGELHIEVKDTQVGDVPRTFQLSWLGSLLLALLPLLVCCCFCCCGLLWLLLLLLLLLFCKNFQSFCQPFHKSCPGRGLAKQTSQS